jgi:hypothetical protein
LLSSVLDSALGKIGSKNLFLLKAVCLEIRPALPGESHLYIPFLGIARPQPQLQHSCVCERFI